MIKVIEKKCSVNVREFMNMIKDKLESLGYSVEKDNLKVETVFTEEGEKMIFKFRIYGEKVLKYFGTGKFVGGITVDGKIEGFPKFEARMLEGKAKITILGNIARGGPTYPASSGSLSVFLRLLFRKWDAHLFDEIKKSFEKDFKEIVSLIEEYL